MSNPYYDQGKNDSFTNNPNRNPPQTSWEREEYTKGQQAGDYLKSQNPKK